MFEIKFIDLCSGVIECLGDFSRKVSLLSQRLTWRHKTVEVNRWTTSELLNGVNSWDNLQTHYSCINCFKDTAQKKWCQFRRDFQYSFVGDIWNFVNRFKNFNESFGHNFPFWIRGIRYSPMVSSSFFVVFCFN